MPEKTHEEGMLKGEFDIFEIGTRSAQYVYDSAKRCRIAPLRQDIFNLL